MILIVSSSEHEAKAFAALCSQRHWPAHACSSLAEFSRIMLKTCPRVVITRQRLSDGYSDDVLSRLSREALHRPSVIVLATADCAAKEETRQISLGAENVFRDPVRIEVLLEIVSRCRTRAAEVVDATPRQENYQFAGVTVFPRELRLTRRGAAIKATPKVIRFIQMLHGNADRVVLYGQLYDLLFEREFAGDTSNCRVLLGKTDALFRRLGVNLRDYIDVIPKSGYVYSPKRER